MIPFPPPAAAVLTLAQAGTLEAPGDLERWVAIITAVATIVIALALIAIFLAVIPLALGARGVQRRITTLLDRIQEQAQPVMLHARSVADNVDYVSTAVRSDVERLKQTIDVAQNRLERAAGAAEDRISRFNSLLELVQDEAESLFIDAAATVRGVRAGTEALREPSPDLAPEWDGYDYEDDEPPAERPVRPRRHH